MVYNISDLRHYSPTNSIFEDSKANPYFTSTAKYPLPLDIVLPAYSWCLVFRDQKFYQIENDLSENDLKKLSFLEKGVGAFYRVKQDTVFHDLFSVPVMKLSQKVSGSKPYCRQPGCLKKARNTADFSVAFFELSESEITNYSYETFEDIYHSFR